MNPQILNVSFQPAEAIAVTLTFVTSTVRFPLTAALSLGERILRNFSPIERLNQWKTSNIEYPTSNIECRRDRKFRCSLDVRRRMFDVGSSWRFMGSLHGLLFAHGNHEPPGRGTRPTGCRPRVLTRRFMERETLPPSMVDYFRLSLAERLRTILPLPEGEGRGEGEGDEQTTADQQHLALGGFSL